MRQLQFGLKLVFLGTCDHKHITQFSLVARVLDCSCRVWRLDCRRRRRNKRRAPAPFTEAQAAAGQTAYAQSCAACHGSTLSGGGEAPAAGRHHIHGFVGYRTTQELFTSIRTSMPPENPNGLGDDTYASDRRVSSQGQWRAERVRPRSRRRRNVPIASIATGEMPAGLRRRPMRPTRGRGRGGAGGRGGADDDSHGIGCAAIRVSP